ncbi:hypothetical protein GCM10027055_26390 [Janibacter alkaliphilus]
MGTTRRDAARFTEVSHDLIDLEMRSQLAGRWRMATMQIVFAAVPAAIYLAAGLPATSGGMTIGTLIAFTTLQAGIFRPLIGLLNVGAQWVSSMALFSRVFEYLDLQPEILPPTDPVDLDRRRSAARCGSTGCPSVTRVPTGTRWPGCRSTSPRAARSPSSGTPARASRRSPRSSRGCTTRLPGA